MFPWRVFQETPRIKINIFGPGIWIFALGGVACLETIGGVQLDWQAFELGYTCRP